MTASPIKSFLSAAVIILMLMSGCKEKEVQQPPVPVSELPDQQEVPTEQAPKKEPDRAMAVNFQEAFQRIQMRDDNRHRRNALMRRFTEEEKAMLEKARLEIGSKELTEKQKLDLLADVSDLYSKEMIEIVTIALDDTNEDVRLEAITLLATVGDPAVLAQVESMARSDPSEKIRSQIERLAKNRQTLRR